MASRRVHSQDRIKPAPQWWKAPCSHIECSLHQLAPYIGKIKSRIAGDLVERYTKSGDLVVDPFAGAGTIPLEATLRGRRAFAADISPYSRILSLAKLSPPPTLNEALKRTESALLEAESLPTPDLRTIPSWVRQFFHPDTLRETLRFAAVARQPGNEFLMACLLGILHHQRPGFLSYPSSHLVPYLRDKKYPSTQFPEMYTYRELRPRLFAKIHRTYRRFERPSSRGVTFRQSAIEHLKMPKRFNALITSPPYMNALDYGRDNRLRLWFINPDLAELKDADIAKRRKTFIDGITRLADKLEKGLTSRGYGVFVVGEEVHRSFYAHPSEVVISIITQRAPSLILRNIIADDIPDVRRTRRECRGIKTEQFLIFQHS
ncbi:MAG: hypothetical protein C4534_09005 [Gaiellales bacterium]|nr:MAG: hypothetical protein C4534_09005 [Gaiellales bacterium]